MNISPTIGIVIPIYNVAPYLKQCLDSVLNQTYGNFQVCLVNDGSTDFVVESKTSPSLVEGDKGGGCNIQNNSNAKFSNNESTHPLTPSARDGEQKIAQSLTIALEYVTKDKRFVLIDKANGGLSSARNVGISWFSNEFVFNGNSSLQGESKSPKSSLRGSGEATTKQSKSHESNKKAESITEKQINADSLQVRDSQKAQNLHNRLPRFANAESRNDEVGTKCHESLCESRNDDFGADCFDLQSKSRNDEINLPTLTTDTPPQTPPARGGALFDSPSRSTSGVREWVISPQMTLYTNPNNTNLTPPKIDYIIFLDSDDFWEVDLLEKCVDSVQKYGVPDIVWFDWREIYEICESKTPQKYHSQTMLELFGYANQTQITATEWLNRAKSKRIYQFWWAWQGIIAFEFLQKIHLRFLEGVIYEDNLFGILLFSQCESIATMPRKLYNYRIRWGSTTTAAKNTKSLPPFVEPLRVEFGDLAWEYFCVFSLCEITLNFAKFCDECDRFEYKERGKLCRANFLPHFLAQSCEILRFDRDIYGTKARFIELLKKERENLQILRIISFITPRVFKTARYFLFLLCIKPQLALFRFKRKALKILRFGA